MVLLTVPDRDLRYSLSQRKTEQKHDARDARAAMRALTGAERPADLSNRHGAAEDARKNMNILALDPALKTAAAHHPSGLVEVWTLASHPAQHRGVTLGVLRDMIHRVNDEHGPLELIAFEDAARGSHAYATRESHSQLAGVIILTAGDLGIPYTAINPSAIKKFATGNGRADKAQMMAACWTQLGIEPYDDNAADALWILEMAKNLHQTSLQNGLRCGD